MKQWLIKLADGRIKGPYTETQIQRGLACGKIDEGMRIRQGDSPWAPPRQVRRLFDQLAEQGFYLRDSADNVHGPFTKARVMALHAGSKLPVKYWIRKGTRGEWTLIDGCPRAKPSSVPTPDIPDTALPRDAMAQRVPPTTIPAAPVMKLRTSTWLDRLTCLSELFDMTLLGQPRNNN